MLTLTLSWLLLCRAALPSFYRNLFTQEERRLEDMILKVAGKSPPWLANFLRAFAPFVTLTFTVLNIVGPVVIKFYALLYKVSAELAQQSQPCIRFFRGPSPLSWFSRRVCTASCLFLFMARSSCVIRPLSTRPLFGGFPLALSLLSSLSKWCALSLGCFFRANLCLRFPSIRSVLPALKQPPGPFRCWSLAVFMALNI